MPIVLILLAVSCGGKETAAPKKPGGAGEPAKPVICPLTGREKPPGTDVSHPALAVKIDNASVARPQAGLESADVVYEELVEGGITRFLVIFHCSAASRIGPIRSARLVDPDILLEYAPVPFGYAGANQIVLDKVRATKGVVSLEHGKFGKAYERVAGRKAPHNLFTSDEKLRALSDVKGPPKPGFVFAAPPAAPAPGASPATPAPPPANTIAFSFGGGDPVRYTYDAGSQSYLRFHGQNPHKAENGSQLKATNIVTMKVKVTQGTIRDAAGNFSPETSVIGAGEVTVWSHGTVARGKWQRATLNDKTAFVNDAGQPVTLVPGNTWIHLVPDTQAITIQ